MLGCVVLKFHLDKRPAWAVRVGVKKFIGEPNFEKKCNLHLSWEDVLDNFFAPPDKLSRSPLEIVRTPQAPKVQ